MANLINFSFNRFGHHNFHGLYGTCWGSGHSASHHTIIKTATLTVMALSITQRNATFISALCSCSVANKQIMLSVVMMGIVMLSNAAPITHKNTSFKNILS
jgi:hypothetical protein